MSIHFLSPRPPRPPPWGHGDKIFFKSLEVDSDDIGTHCIYETPLLGRTSIVGTRFIRMGTRFYAWGQVFMRGDRFYIGGDRACIGEDMIYCGGDRLYIDGDTSYISQKPL